MPFEPIPDHSQAPRTAEEYASWEKTGAKDRVHSETKSAAQHASDWFAGAKHLINEEDHPKIEKILRMAHRGILTGSEINDQMYLTAGPLYHEFDPSHVPFNVPSHLGEQFKTP